MLGFYFNPNGRITRKDFWLKFVLVLIGISLVANFVDGLVFPYSGIGTSGPIEAIATFATLWPQIAITAKRFHDRNMSGWWQILFNIAIFGGTMTLGVANSSGAFAAGADLDSEQLTMLLGGLALILVSAGIELVILGFMPGTKGPNKYGDDPLNPTRNIAEVFS